MENRTNRISKSSTPRFSERKIEVLTITDEITNTSLEIRVNFSSPFPDRYNTLIREVYEKFGLHGDTFQLRNVRENTLYPRCLEYMTDLQYKPLAEMGIYGGDKLVIVRILQVNSPSGVCQESPMNVADKMNQTEPDNSTDLIRVHMFPSERVWNKKKAFDIHFGLTVPNETEWYKANEFDIYVRQYYRIIDLSDEFRRVYRNQQRPSNTIWKWKYKGETFSAEDTTTLTTVGISDGSEIQFEYDLSIPLNCAGDSENLFSSRTIGVQTVAKPAVQYPPVQPPPPVHNPPPAKT